MKSPKKSPKKKSKKAKPKTIKFSELKRLSFCNSSKLPQKIIVDGQVKEWVGIGWLDIDDKPSAKYPTVVDG